MPKRLLNQSTPGNKQYDLYFYTSRILLLTLNLGTNMKIFVLTFWYSSLAGIIYYYYLPVMDIAMIGILEATRTTHAMTNK